jgi:ABC-type uncharacterized transport system substrate-binding protein
VRRRDAIALIGSVAVCPASAFGQQSNKVPRIGWIILGSPAGTHPDIFSYYESFRAGLQDLGYVEGTNLTILSKDAEGVPEGLPKLIDELIGENVSIIVSPGPAIKVVREKVQSIPVVFAFSGDPVAGGLVDTLAHGRRNMAVQLNGKRLDLLKELSPSITQVTLLTNPIHPGEKLEVAESQRVAAALDMRLNYLQVRTPAEFDAAFQTMREVRTEAIVAVPDNLIMLARDRLAQFAMEQKIPVISGWGEFAHSGGLMTYGPNSTKFFRRLGVYVDKILKGAKPSELPIEQPTTFELVINLKTARAIGLVVPASLIVQADEVIE